MPVWPHQSDCDTFYGDPRGDAGGAHTRWENENLTRIRPPFNMFYEGRWVSSLLIHRKCADSLHRVLSTIWLDANEDQSLIDEWGVSVYAGCYNYRLIRGGNRLSMHAYGCAIDLDPERNGLGDRTPNFANHPHIIEAFESEGWEWGGRWSRPDGMHFQAART